MPVITLSRLKTRHGKALKTKKGRVNEIASGLPAAIHGKRGGSATRMADILERPYTTVCGWPERMHRMGPEGSLRDKHPGAACGLNPERPETPKDAAMRGPAACGFPSGARTVPMLAARVKRKFGVVYGTVGMNRLPHRNGFSRRKPRPRHPKAATRDRIEKFKKESREIVPEYTARGCTVMAGDAYPRTTGPRVERGRCPEGADAKPAAPPGPSGERFNAFGAPSGG